VPAPLETGRPSYGTTMILPFIPKLSCKAQMYGYVPAAVNVMRKRVLPSGDVGKPMRSHDLASVYGTGPKP
jgi:hypothetical protein